MRLLVSRFAGLGVAFLLALVFLAPTLHMPFLGDDTFNNYLDGWMGYEHLTPWQGLASLFQAGNVASGRFYPIFTLLLFGEFHFIHSVEIIKWLVVLAIIVNALTLYVLLRLAVPKLALPTIALLPAVWQMRFFHDPILQFSLHMQLTLEFVLLGLIGLVVYARDGRWWKLALASGAYMLACMTYEPTYAYALVFLALAVTIVPTRSRKALACVAFTLPPLACATVAFWFRAVHPLAPSDQHAVHAVFAPAATAFIVQALGALPLSYRAFNPSGVFAGNGRPWGLGVLILAALAFAAIAIAYAKRQNVHQHLDEDRRVLFAAAISGIAWLASGVVVALSPRWQSELIPGLAYLPVYLAESFVAVLLAALGYAVVRTFPRRLGRYVFAAIGAAVIAATYADNARALVLYAPWNVTLPQALDAGLLGDAPQGATVFLDDSYPAQSMFGVGTWDTKYYLFYHTAKRFIGKPLVAMSAPAAKNTFVVLGWSNGFDRGAAIAGRVVGISRNGDGVDPLVTSVRRFRREPYRESILSTWNSRCGPVGAKELLEGAPSAMTLAFVGPFYAEERSGTERWRWSSADAALQVDNSTNVSRSARVQFTVRAIDSETRLRISGLQTSVADSGGDMLVSSILKIAPHAHASIELTSSSPGETRPPDTRRLLFQVRDATLLEPGC